MKRSDNDLSLLGLSLYEMHDRLANFSSQRRMFFWWIVELTKCAPTTVSTWLCGTYLPGKASQEKIAAGLNAPIDVLFPPDGNKGAGTLVYRYKMLRRENAEMHKFVNRLAVITGVSAKCVKRWFRFRRIPKQWQRAAIARNFGVSPTTLFPNE